MPRGTARTLATARSLTVPSPEVPAALHCLLCAPPGLECTQLRDASPPLPVVDSALALGPRSPSLVRCRFHGALWFSNLPGVGQPVTNDLQGQLFPLPLLAISQD